MALSQLVFKAILLIGLLMTGVVDEAASAGSALTDQEIGLAVFGPAAVELRIETDYDVIIRTVYFPRDSIDLTPEAGLVLLEIALEVSALENPTILISSPDSDRLLAFERINSVVRELEAGGLASASLFTWSEIGLLTPRQL